jgi:beta-ribofuranosylaminobenzene 5'-phosphate synthase
MDFSGIAAVIEIHSFPRIHISLLSMHHGGYRINGGLGFAIDGPLFCVSAVKANQWNVSSVGCELVDAQTLRYVENRLIAAQKLSQFSTPIEIKIQTSIASHTGLGSSTALCLSAIEAAALANNIQLSRDQLISLSGRGGASGVGINTYFDGGLSMDFGRKAGIAEQLKSSETAVSASVPLRIGRTDLEAWPLAILIPSHIQTKSIAEEQEFFERVCPLPIESSQEVIYHATMGTYAAAVERDYSSFCRSINAIQKCTWKSAELSLYGDEVSDCIESLLSSGADAAGMSSLGPCVYFFAADPEEVLQRSKRVTFRWNAIRVHPSNSGRIIAYV